MYYGELAMTGTGPAMMNQPVLMEGSGEETLETRFGRIRVARDRAVVFSSGLLGMPDRLHFCLTNFPSPKMARFTLLQSLDDPSLSFITLPIDLQNPIVATADIEQAARDLDIPVTELACLLVVTVSREAGATQITVNARAPLFIHVTKRIAGQYVFANNRYDIRHPLTL